MKFEHSRINNILFNEDKNYESLTNYIYATEAEKVGEAGRKALTDFLNEAPSYLKEKPPESETLKGIRERIRRRESITGNGKTCSADCSLSSPQDWVGCFPQKIAEGCLDGNSMVFLAAVGGIGIAGMILLSRI